MTTAMERIRGFLSRASHKEMSTNNARRVAVVEAAPVKALEAAAKDLDDVFEAMEIALTKYLVTIKGGPKYSYALQNLENIKANCVHRARGDKGVYDVVPMAERIK